MNSSNGASCLSGGAVFPNSRAPLENTDVYNVSLMRRAIMEQKHIVPIEHILLPNKIRFLTAGLLVLCMNVQMQMGYPLVQHTPFVCFCFVIRRDIPRQSQYNQARGSMVIKDLTGHYKVSSLLVLFFTHRMQSRTTLRFSTATVHRASLRSSRSHCGNSVS